MSGPPRDDYDLVIIGAGSAGLAAASFARALGATVLVVEKDRVGGDCTWTGCVPSKALLAAAGAAQSMRTAAQFGLPAVAPAVDLAAIMARVGAAVQRVYASETPEILAAHGIDTHFGSARFLDGGTIEVAGVGSVRGRRFLIATGAVPSRPSIPGLDTVPHLTYLDVYSMTALPRSLAVLGGGPIGIEMAQAFQRLGSAVTLVEAADRILPVADPEASALLASRLRAEGMTILTGAKVTAVAARGAGIELAIEGGAPIAAASLLVATGRRPHIEGLDLQRAGVESTPRGIVVDGHLRTTQANIHAAGDVTGSFQFTHYAGWQGFTAVRNLFLPLKAPATRPNVPWVVFTDPEVAQVGLTEAEVAESGDRFEVHRWPAERNDRAQAVGETETLLKIVASPGAGRVLGATIVAGRGGELVNEIALAIENNLKVSDLAGAIHAYPTYGMAIQQLAAEASVDQFAGSTMGKFLKGFVR